MSAKPSTSASTDNAARAGSSAAPDLVRHARGACRASRRRHHLPAPESAACSTIRCASPTACIIGPRLRPIASSWPSATPRGAGGRSPMRSCSPRRGTSPPRCWRAAFPPRSRSSFSPAIRSIMRLIAFGALYAGIPVLPGIAGLFAGVAGLRQARLSDEAADARSRVCRRRHEIRRCAGGQRIPWQSRSPLRSARCRDAT